MKKFRSLILLFFVVIACVLMISNEQIFAGGNSNFIPKENWNKAKVSENYHGNYLAFTLQQNGYLWRWHHTSFPLKVYITSQTEKPLPSYFDTDVRKAFQTWQSNSGGIVSFVFVNSANQADIVVYFKNSTLQRQSGGETTLGTTQHRASGKQLGKPVVIDLIPYKTGTVYQSSGTLYAVALHEIGHSLGLGHSNNQQDNMTPLKHLTIGKLSKGDLNTLKLLYSVIPDVCDKPYGDEYRSKYVTSEDIKNK